MQKIKHIICGLLAVAMLIGGAVSASAATRIQHTQNSIVGDADNDNAVRINDATLLQKQLAEYSTELDVTNAYTHAVLDANQDNKITIGDVTEIQRYLAELPVAHVSKAIPTTTAHTHVYTTTVEKKLVEESYTFHDGGEWEMHVFCRKCGEDLTIMHKKWMEENGVKQGDFYADLASWFQKKHNKTTLMKSPTHQNRCIPRLGIYRRTGIHLSCHLQIYLHREVRLWRRETRLRQTDRIPVPRGHRCGNVHRETGRR